tara:strand:+ start:340 stop:549 length:210 start_codon:yes stop_codon:yes gene_type:complete
MIGYVIGPALALALGMRFTAYTKNQTIKDLTVRIETLEADVEKKAAQQMLMTMTPLIKKVKDISTTLGV